MKLTEEEQKFAINEKVGVYPSPRFARDTSSGSLSSQGWEILIIRRADVLVRVHDDSREEAFKRARVLYAQVVQKEHKGRVRAD